MKKDNFPALSGIRFLAASMVFFCHYPSLLVAKDEQPFFFYLLRQMNVGVNVFFVLSGFLITYRYYEIAYDRTNLQSYFVKRFARIFPLYFLLLLFHYAIKYWHGSNGVSTFELSLNVTLLKGLSSRYYLSGIAQSWSLTVEEMFYAFAPVCFLLIKAKIGMGKQVIGLLAAGFAVVAIFHFFPYEGFFQSLTFMFSATFFGRCFEFFCGIYIALLVLKNQHSGTRQSNYTMAGGILFSLLLILLAGYASSTKVEAVNKTLFGIFLFNFTMPVVVAMMLYGLVKEKTFLQKILASPPFVLLGKSSYAFYLLHLGFAAEVVYFHLSSHWLILFSSLQLLSFILYVVVEKPVYLFLLRKNRPFRRPVLQAETVVNVVS